MKKKNDRRLRDTVAQWMGDIARFLPLEWYERTIEIWAEEVDYKPKYYWIAWRAALSDAPRHALVAARFAADRFNDDAAFIAEYEFMQELFEESTDEDSDG